MATNSVSNEVDVDTVDTSPKVVLVTGGTGYIAKHVVLQLLDAGHSVKTSTRSILREQELRDALAAHVRDADDALARLQVIELDLTMKVGLMLCKMLMFSCTLHRHVHPGSRRMKRR